MAKRSSTAIAVAFGAGNDALDVTELILYAQDATNVNDIDSDSRQPQQPASKQVQQLEAKLASVQQQLTHQASQGRHSDGAQLSVAANSSYNYARPALPPLPPNQGASPVVKIVIDCVIPSSPPDRIRVLAEFLGVDVSGASMRLGEALIQALLDASTLVCCARMPALRNLTGRASFLKATVHNLEPADQEVVGVPSYPLNVDAVPANAFIPAGVARDAACNGLRRAMNDVCWSGGLLQDASWEAMQSIAGLTELLAFEEAQAKDNHFFLRNAIGTWLDLVNDINGPTDRPLLQQLLGSSLLADDAYMAAHTRTRLMFGDDHIEQELRHSGVIVPSFQSQRRLADILNDLIGENTRVDLENFTQALEVASMHVTKCFRTFSSIYAGRDNMQDTAVRVRTLYSNIDETHATIQRFQQSLVAVSQHLSQNMGDPEAPNHLILLAVRLDFELVELVCHLFNMLQGLASRCNGVGAGYDQMPHELSRTKAESELRLRKCFKLAAFYAKLYLTSVDKHVLFHLLNTLEVVPLWTAIAAQQVGDPGGPLSEEYEISFDELDNLRRALHLCCFYTARAFPRLRELGHFDAPPWSAGGFGANVPTPVTPSLTNFLPGNNLSVRPSTHQHIPQTLPSVLGPADSRPSTSASSVFSQGEILMDFGEYPSHNA
ncbi:hypothetical protein OIO90_002838 [Microbotryomycetes sp. JL221]|nr:hypothetical protein OIO90_002838 [Microbotryomycetes sp. JL221]